MYTLVIYLINNTISNLFSNDQAIIKQENITVIHEQVINGVIKREYVDETDHNNDSQLFETG